MSIRKAFCDMIGQKGCLSKLISWQFNRLLFWTGSATNLWTAPLFSFYLSERNKVPIKEGLRWSCWAVPKTGSNIVSLFFPLIHFPLLHQSWWRYWCQADNRRRTWHFLITLFQTTSPKFLDIYWIITKWIRGSSFSWWNILNIKSCKWLVSSVPEVTILNLLYLLLRKLIELLRLLENIIESILKLKVIQNLFCLCVKLEQ